MPTRRGTPWTPDLWKPRTYRFFFSSSVECFFSTWTVRHSSGNVRHDVCIYLPVWRCICMSIVCTCELVPSMITRYLHKLQWKCPVAHWPALYPMWLAGCRVCIPAPPNHLPPIHPNASNPPGYPAPNGPARCVATRPAIGTRDFQSSWLYPRPTTVPDHSTNMKGGRSLSQILSLLLLSPLFPQL